MLEFRTSTALNISHLFPTFLGAGAGVPRTTQATQKVVLGLELLIYIVPTLNQGSSLNRSLRRRKDNSLQIRNRLNKRVTNNLSNLSLSNLQIRHNLIKRDSNSNLIKSAARRLTKLKRLNNSLSNNTLSNNLDNSNILTNDSNLNRADTLRDNSLDLDALNPHRDRTLQRRMITNMTNLRISGIAKITRIKRNLNRGGLNFDRYSGPPWLDSPE